MKAPLLASLAFLGIGIVGCSKRPAPVVTEERIDQEISGVGSSEMQPQQLFDGLFFSVISKSPSNTLHWKLTKGSGSAMAGEAALPGEKYAYYFDKEKKMFWFATARTISSMDVSGWTSTQILSRGGGFRGSTEGFESYDDLPPTFRDNIRRILN